MHHRTYRIAHTTTFVTPVVEHWLKREITQWVFDNSLAKKLYPTNGHQNKKDLKDFMLNKCYLNIFALLLSFFLSFGYYLFW